MPLAYGVTQDKLRRVILDTDTACEADDPFAVAHALLSPKLVVRAVVAEHFARENSMEKSADALRALFGAMYGSGGASAPILAGQPWPLDPRAEISQGVRFIIDEARREDARPLFVLCLGALSNMARALLHAPDIAKRLTVVTIGGHGYTDAPIPFREFNFGNDINAANFVLGSDAPLWQIPACAYTSVRVGLAELQKRVKPCGRAGAYLFEQMNRYNQSQEAAWTAGESWSLGDSPAVAAVLHPGCGTVTRRKVRAVLTDTSYGAERPECREILVYDTVDSRYILEDFFAKLSLMYPPQ